MCNIYFFSIYLVYRLWKGMARSATPAEIAPNVIQSEAKNLDDTHVNVSEILHYVQDDKMFKLSFAPKFGQNRDL